MSASANHDPGSSDVSRLLTLLHAAHRCVRVITFEEDEALRIVRDAAMETGVDLSLWSSVRGLESGLVKDADAVRNTENPVAALYRLTQVDKPVLLATLDLASHLREDRALRAWRDLLAKWRDMAQMGTHSAMVMIDHAEDAPPVVAAESVRLDLSYPDEAELEVILRRTIRAHHRISPVSVEITREALAPILRNLRGLTRRQAELVVGEAVSDDRRFDAGDLERVLNAKRRMVAAGGLLEFVQAPADLSHVGGMNRLKAWLQQRERVARGEGTEIGLGPPRGVLLLGVQGAGKSLCAKAVATAWRRPLLRLDAGALYDRYVGESERRLREALRQAEAMAPAVLWIDEIEKAFASAASQSTDGGLSKRMFGSLLTWMQEHRAHVFLVATANDIEALPPELLRKGRFDEIFFVDLPSAAARDQILRIHLTRRNQSPATLDMPSLVRATDGYSGSEIEQGIIATLTQSLAANGKSAHPTTDRFVEVFRASPPLSVTMAERVADLRAWAKGRCVPAE